MFVVSYFPAGFEIGFEIFIHNDFFAQRFFERRGVCDQRIFNGRDVFLLQFFVSGFKKLLGVNYNRAFFLIFFQFLFGGSEPVFVLFESFVNRFRIRDLSAFYRDGFLTFVESRRNFVRTYGFAVGRRYKIILSR